MAIIYLMAEDMTLPSGIEQGGFIGTLVFVVLAFLGALKWLYDRMATANTDLSRQYKDDVGKLLETFRVEQRYEREMCEKHFDTLIQSSQRHHDNILEAIKHRNT